MGANFNYNKIILGGRLTADPELSQTPSGVSVLSFSVAVNRRQRKDGEPQADFFACQAWRGTAEFISKFFRRGSSIFIVGSLQTRTWTDKDGGKRHAVEIIVDEANFVDGRSESGREATNTYVPDSYTAQEPEIEADKSEPKFETVEQDDDLPF